MNTYKEKFEISYTYPHIDIYSQYDNNEHYGYKVLAHNGYVFYDTKANDTEQIINEETGEIIEKPVVYYSTIRLYPRNYVMNSLSLIAIKESDINEEKI